MRTAVRGGLAVLATLALLPALAPTAAADGTLTWVGANTDTTGDQDGSSVASTGTGYTAVVWEDDRDDAADPLHTDVWVRLFLDGTGVFEKKVTAGGTGDWRHANPDVAVRPDGSTVVGWSDDRDGNGYFEVFAQAYDAAGASTGTVKVNTVAAGQQTNPEVAVDPDSAGFAVVFQDVASAGAEPRVLIAGFTSIAARAYDPKPAHAAGGGHRDPDVAMGAAGNAIVVWDEDKDGNGYYNIGLASFTPSGGAKLTQRIANRATGDQQVNASVAASANGDFAVSWESRHDEATTQVAVRSFTAAGGAAAEVFLGAGTDPQAGIDDQRNAVAFWAASTDVYVQGVNPDGTPTGRQPLLRANQATAGPQGEPALAVDGYGRITLTHTDDADGDGADEVLLGTGLTNSVWA